MHVIIMGCGRVGASLAGSLAARGHTISIIDQHPDAFRRLGAHFTGQLVAGVGFDHDVLRQAGVERADAFAAVSSGDNSNIISARVARETFGVARVVARIYDSKRAEVYERLGIPTVATVRWTADQILRLLGPELPAEQWRDPSGAVAIQDLGVHPGWVGRPLRALEEASGVRVAYLTRFGTGTLPTASTILQAGDQLSFLLTDQLLPHVRAVVATAPRGG